MNIGAFVSTAGGLMKMLDRADALGVESIMMFASSPQSWKRRIFDPGDISAFRHRFTDTGYDSLWIHGTYLMNFGTANPAALRQSIDTLVLELEDAARLGARGVIFHLGSHNGRGFPAVLSQIIDGLKEAASRAPDGPLIVLENSAGMGGSIGSKFTELGQLIKQIDHPRMAVCLDTQHAFAAGYAMYTEDGLQQTLQEFDETIGLDRLVVLHANDSKVPFAGGRDRHENIGEGYITDAGWRVLLVHPALNTLPFLLEVPGLDGHGPDKPNVDRLRRLAQTSV